MAEHLKALGYAPLTVDRHLGLVGRLSRFLQRQGLHASQINPEVVEKFLGTVWANRGLRLPTSKTLAWLLAYLREIGVLPAPVSPPPHSWEEELVERYRPYL